ncbi:MAG: hypothetical protein IJ062_02505 [Firmicutes bacterium]|nr:hypothetical protein [Bacillota bacterium]
MLMLPPYFKDEEANKIVTRFVNKRLLDLMQEIILDEVSWNLAMAGQLNNDAASQNFDELVDIESLIYDMDFAENISMTYLPDNYPIERANYNFFGLYKLLKAKKEYVPELAMEYILYHIIYSAVGEIELIGSEEWEEIFYDDQVFWDEEDEDYSTVINIPEPDRTAVLNAIRNENPNFSEEEIEETINLFEDLREYGNVCFWDTDFTLLDKYTEEEIKNSELNERMGIIDMERSNIIKIPFGDRNGKSASIKTEFLINQWDLEEE